MDIDTTTYTSFQPLVSEEETSGFSLSRLFYFNRKSAAKQETSNEESVDGNSICEDKPSESEKQAPKILVSKSEMGLPAVARKYRNVKTILRRLSAIAIDRRWHQSTGDFKHNFKQYWMPDEHCKECYECGDKFTTFRRRHHCRVCGQIFCRKCCNQVVPGRVMGFSGDIRVCNYCCKIVQVYLNDNLEQSIEAIREDIKVYSSIDESSEQMFSGSGSLNSSRSSLTGYYFENRDLPPRIPRAGSCNSLPSTIERDIHTRSPTPVRSVFDAFGVTPKEANNIKQDYLRDLWHEITDPRSKLELQSHRYRLKTYPNCFVGHDLVDWLITYGKASSRAQAVAIGQDLLDNGWIEPVYATEEGVFRDEYMLYQPGKIAMQDMEFHPAYSAPSLALLGDTDSSPKALRRANFNVEDSMSMVYEEDDTLPIWFRQLPSDTSQAHAENEINTVPVTPATSRRFSSGRHLDLDHIDPMESEHMKPSELSLQMKLDHFSEAEKLQVRKELYDQKNKLSLITHVPPPPLDTYVCVEGQAFTSKKKFGKVMSSAHLTDDVLRGVLFPKPGEEQLDLDDTVKDDHFERLAKERLTFATQHHIHSTMYQLLNQEGLDETWKDIILPVVRKISEQVIPDVRRDDDMDIRQYVWFKKIPGADKSDCQYISGVTFTKNVAHKKMSCTFQQPKILMLACAIEYGQRVENKLASLDPLVLQEYEFLKNFIARLVALKPNLVLVEKSVARFAQDMLLAAGITLIHNIKSSVMDRVSRCTGADILQSMEQVSRPRLGSCQRFYLQKYPFMNGEYKTLMFFEGCAPDLGCSLVLRGGTLETLKKVKRIIKYLTYVSYHLKLESRFLMDEFALPPPLENLKPSISTSSLNGSGISKKSKDSTTLEKISENSGDEAVSESDVTGSDGKETVNQFIKCLNNIVLSSSPFCQYNLPFLLTHEASDLSCRVFIPEKIYSSSYLGDDMEPEQLQKETKAVEPNPNIILKDSHVFTKPTIVARIDDQKIQAVVADYRARGGLVDLKMFHDYEEWERKKRRETTSTTDVWLVEGKQCQPKKDENDALDEEIFSSRSLGTLEPKEKLDCFNAYNHQRLAVLFSSHSSESHNAPKPCISPWAVFMEFYGRNDITLGGFLERYCFRPSYICSSHNCDVPMINHVRYFAHGIGSLYIHMRNLESPIPGYDRTILTWSWCKQCKQVTPVVPLSFESWSLSFAKYLEIRFYGHLYKRRASSEPCQHSLHHEHYQYFSFANMVASFKYRKIELFEVLIPSLSVEIGKDRNPGEWCQDVRTFCTLAEININLLMERITALTDPVVNASREAKIKEFLTDVKKEYFHFNECIDCLKMKADSLRQAHFTTGGDDDSSTSSAEERYGDSLCLDPTEMSTLKSDVANLLVNLKRDLCEIIERWNAKLQEYVQLEKKREKTTRPSSPPKGVEPRQLAGSSCNEQSDYIQANGIESTKTEKSVASSLNSNMDFKPDYYAFDETVHSSVYEPVSEIFYSSETTGKSPSSTVPVNPPDNKHWKEATNVTDGVENINRRRQTSIDQSDLDDYDGDVFAVLKDDNELDDLSAGRQARKGSELFTIIHIKDEKSCGGTAQEGDSNVDVSFRTEKSSSDVNVSSCSVEARPSSSQRGGSSLENASIMADQGSTVDDDISVSAERKARMERSSSDSQIIGIDKTHKDEMRKKFSDTVVFDKISEFSDFTDSRKSRRKFQMKGASNDSISSGASSESVHDHWMIGTKKRTGTVINTFETGEETAESSRNMGNEDLYHSREFDDSLSCCSSLMVEVYSEDEVSELSSVRECEDLDYESESDSSASDAEKRDSANLTDSELCCGIEMGESAVDYEQSSTKWLDSRKREDGMDASSIVWMPDVDGRSSAFAPPKKMPFALNTEQNFHFSQPAVHISSPAVKATSLEESTYFRPIPNDKGEGQENESSKITQQSDKEKLEEAISNESKLESSILHTSDNIRVAKSSTAMQDKIPHLIHAEAGLPQPDRQNCPVTSDEPQMEEKRTGLFGILANNDAKLAVHSRSEPSLTEQVENVQTQARTTMQNAKFGHRRMASAPILSDVRNDNETSDFNCYVVSPAIHDSSFVYIEHLKSKVTETQPHKSRSAKLSLGSLHSLKEGQETLVKLAKQICQEDRRDVEYDDPEEIQYEEGVEVSESGLSSKATDASKEFLATGASSIPVSEADVEDGDKKLTKMKKDLLNEGYDSGKESVASGATAERKKGHSRQRSLPQKQYQCSIDDSDALRLSSLEGSSSVAPNKKGTEKMKKIISQFLPGSNFTPIPSPFPPHEHYMMPPGESISIVINEKEPTSIIAYTLGSHAYLEQLTEVQGMLDGKNRTTQGNKISHRTPTPTKESNSDTRDSSPNPSTPQKRELQGVALRPNEKMRNQRPRSWAGTSNIRSPITLHNVLEKDELDPKNFSQEKIDSLQFLSPALDSLLSGETASGDTSDFTLSNTALPTAEGESKDGVLEEEIPDTDSVDDLLDDKDDNESLRSEVQEGKKKEDRKSSVDYHIKLQFHDSSAKFYCSVYFAEQFRRLRSIIFPEGEERYIRSLARCVLWRARGGKSGSSFSKSLDDRFVMKQMSRLELQSFVDFGPYYFDYINRVIKENRPTAMAKLLGVYRIGFKNSQTNTTMRQDILVMENVFYGRKVNKIFDLKGSVRSRYVHTSAKEDVLMDENLLEMICDSPLFIRPHSKAILSKAIHNDTEFLAKHMVMDYSLLVGIDEANFQLVVGIIDYIRTFTWDKKLESYVKSTGILGGQGKMPTVVSPEVYQNRFVEAMQRYFLMVPDKWTGFGTELD